MSAVSVRSGEEASRGRGRRKRSTTKGKLRRETNIDSVVVEFPFTFSIPKEGEDGGGSAAQTESSNNEGAGDGCFVSATVQNRRYYGLLVDEAAIREASKLYFESEASSLELNRRIDVLHRETLAKERSTDELGDGKMGATSTSSSSLEDIGLQSGRQVQKFRYVQPSSGVASVATPGNAAYRELLATFANVEAASDGDAEKHRLIRDACEFGGNFVGDYYYQYEPADKILKPLNTTGSALGSQGKTPFHYSLSMEGFLRRAELPLWYPLSNLQCGQAKILSMLQMKKNNNGGVGWEGIPKALATASAAAATLSSRITSTIPMSPRRCFRVGIVGGGIAGLSCAEEILRLISDDNLDVEVVLLEGRSRVGGRIVTDTRTFQGKGTPFPVDLGAAWIHGINGNPLAKLAADASVDYALSGEDVKMLCGNMKVVVEDVDLQMGRTFDDLLDWAAEASWQREEYTSSSTGPRQNANRWYASSLIDDGKSTNSDLAKARSTASIPSHRVSSDVSIDHAIGSVMTKKRDDLGSSLTLEQKRLLLWHTKNTEYALGANIADLSMKFWDADDRHAFSGDHVLLQQGYSHLTTHLLRQCEKSGKRFKLELDSCVNKLEYGRETATQPYIGKTATALKTVDLSDSCLVNCANGTSHLFDFMVCALPLGVLKHSLYCSHQGGKREATEASKEGEATLRHHPLLFHPPLPEWKKDAIGAVGFGLLNKVVLQFSTAFWRRDETPDSCRSTPFLGRTQTVFGNASGLNSHHYMFIDLGHCSRGGSTNEDVEDNVIPSVAPPAILLSLVSGADAVRLEQESQDVVVAAVMETLRHLFSDVEVPDPIAARTTRWGSDEFSRGSYSFLGPGATDDDYRILQCPINSKGESPLLGSSSTMRLFFCGEHTSTLHPSTAHGAYLSGVRAAQDVLSNLRQKSDEPAASDVDTLIPITVFRQRHPDYPLKCAMCQLRGSREREGALLSFQRGSRQVLVHSKCAELSPEVEVRRGQWRNVVKAVNRGKLILCSSCGFPGATIGCIDPTCVRTFHFTCACEKDGWNFERDGKAFECGLHRASTSVAAEKTTNPPEMLAPGETRVSLEQFRAMHPFKAAVCALCSCAETVGKSGELVGRERGDIQILVHTNCLQYTNILDKLVTTDEPAQGTVTSPFHALQQSLQCFHCRRGGATLTCCAPGCLRCCHFPCGEAGGWKLASDRLHKCPEHSNAYISNEEQQPNSLSTGGNASMGFKHDLFFTGSRTHRDSPQPESKMQALDETNEKRSAPDDGTKSGKSTEKRRKLTIPLLPLTMDPHLVDESLLQSHPNRVDLTMHRSSTSQSWNIALSVHIANDFVCTIRPSQPLEQTPLLRADDVLLSIDGVKVGSVEMTNLVDVLKKLRFGTRHVFEILRRGEV